MSQIYCDPLDKGSYDLRLMSQITMLLSLVGSLFVICMYSCFKEARNFAYKLILQISISDFIYCAAHFFGKGLYLNQSVDPGVLCYIQAFLVNFSMEASFLWTMLVAWTLFSTTVLSRPAVQKRFWLYCIYGYMIPLIASTVPFMTNDYGAVGYRCWITLANNATRGKVLRLVLWYVPLWIVVVFNSIAYFKVIGFMKQFPVGKHESRIIRRLRAYPLILVLCWVCATIHSIYILFKCESELNVFDMISAGLADLTGFFNAIAYGLNAHIQTIIKRKCPCCRIFLSCWWCRSNEKNVIEEGETTNNNLNISDSLILSNSDIEMSYRSR